MKIVQLCVVAVISLQHNFLEASAQQGRLPSTFEVANSNPALWQHFPNVLSPRPLKYFADYKRNMDKVSIVYASGKPVGEYEQSIVLRRFLEAVDLEAVDQDLDSLRSINLIINDTDDKQYSITRAVITDKNQITKVIDI